MLSTVLRYNCRAAYVTDGSLHGDLLSSLTEHTVVVAEKLTQHAIISFELFLLMHILTVSRLLSGLAVLKIASMRIIRITLHHVVITLVRLYVLPGEHGRVT